jgi:hypothetical protein
VFISPAHPKRAETRSFPSFVLVSSKSSKYPRGYASGFDFACGLVGRLFEHPFSRANFNPEHSQLKLKTFRERPPHDDGVLKRAVIFQDGAWNTAHLLKP